MLEGKLTLPVLYALNRANDNQATEIALKVKEGTATLDEIARLIAFTKENGGIEYAVRTMNAYKQKPLGCWPLCRILLSAWLSGLIWITL